MTSNVISILSRQPIIQPPDTPDWHPNFAAMPSWITLCKPLNEKITEMQQKGWQIMVEHDGEILCRRKDIDSGEWMNFVDAQNAQWLMDCRRARS